MKRASNLQRKAPMWRKSWKRVDWTERLLAAKVAALSTKPQARSRRKPLRRVGARSRREAGALQAFRVAVLAKTGGAFARCGSRKDVHAHHTRPRSCSGGVHDQKIGDAL